MVDAKVVVASWAKTQDTDMSTSPSGRNMVTTLTGHKTLTAAARTLPGLTGNSPLSLGGPGSAAAIIVPALTNVVDNLILWYVSKEICKANNILCTS